MYEEKVCKKMKTLESKNSHVNSRFSIGEKILFKSIKSNQFLLPQYIGPAEIIQIDHKKCYSLKSKDRIWRRHESHLKRMHQVGKDEKNHFEGIKTDSRYPKRERKEVVRYIWILFIYMNSVITFIICFFCYLHHLFLIHVVIMKGMWCV